MAGGILSGLFGGGDSSVMPGLLDQAGYMDPAEYDRRRQGNAMQGLWAGLLQGSGPSLEPRNFFSALGSGLVGSQKFGNDFDEAALRRAQGMSAYQKSQLERQKLKLATDIYGEALPKSGSTGAPPAAPGAGSGGGGTGTGNLSDPRGLVPYIRAEAARLNIDPDIAVRVAGSEGLGTFLGDGGKSGGAFQLYTGGGVGNLFQRDTGLDPLDPANEKATITYALQHAAKNGWGDWNGAKKLGITGYTGIGKPGEPSAANVTDLSAVPDFAGAMMGRQGASYAPATPPPMPGAVVAGAPGPAPALGATVAPIEKGTSGYLQPIGAGQPGATVGGRQPTAVPPVTSVPGPTNGIDPRRGAALEQILRGQEAAQAGPLLRQLAQFAGPGAAGPVASAAIPPPLPEAPPEAIPLTPPGAAPSPGAITYGSGVLGRAAAAPATASAAPPSALPPAAAAPAPGGIPGAATATPPAAPNTLFGMPLPVLPAAPPTPQVPAIPGLLSPGAPPALQPLAPVGAVPPVQLSPEQAARTQRAQRLSLALDLIGVTVPKFIADEAGIDVAARSAQAQEAAKQPFAVQMERLRGDIAQQRSEFEAKSKLQQDEYATKRGFATDQFKSALGQLDDIVKQYTAAGLAGPVAGSQERAKLEEQARLSPGIAMASAEGTARGTQLGKLNETIDDNARVARTNIADLKNMQTAAQGLAMRGIFADQTQFANQLMNALTGEQKDRVAAYEMVTKNSEKLVREQTRLSDNQPAAIQLVMTRNSMPTARTSEIGFDGVLSQMMGAHEYGLYVQQEKVKWQATHPSLQGFEAQLPVSPYAFMVYRMPEHLENQLMAKLRAGGAQGIREAQMLKDQISTLRNQGYGQ